MRRSVSGIAFGLAGCLLCPSLAGAQGMPVIDPLNLAQQFAQKQILLEQAEREGEALAKQIEELAVAIQQRDALQGARGMAKLLNGPEEQQARRGVPGTWQQVLDAVSSDQFPEFARQLQDIYRRLREDPSLVDAVEIFGQALQSASARSHDRVQRTTVANLALSEQAYDGATRRVEAYERLIDEIDQTPDLKASNDLVARLLAENGLAVNELIRLQSLQISGEAAERAAMLATRVNLSEIARFDPEAYAKLIQRRGGER